MKAIEAFLRRTIGMDGSAPGPGAIERIVRRRMQALGLTQIEDYRQHLLAKPDECRELVEAVVVKETWFFRDAEAFTHLARLAVEEWLPRNSSQRMRVLSLPCSSGEEPFSIVMALLDGGLPPDRFLVDAVDISHYALAGARRCLYGNNSFRGKDLSFRERHFHHIGEDYAINPGLRPLVHFAQGNLLNPEFAAAHPKYDFIFFRNLLIYLDRDAQSSALRRIDQLLDEEGMLFVGPAEQPTASDWGFVSAQLPSAFAFSKKAARQLQPERGCLESPPPLDSTEARFRQSAFRPSQTDLGQARGLADAGQLTEAAAICEAHLRQNQFSAQAYYLLGLVREAQDDPKALECYRKALYLEPNHYQTLLQLAVLARKNGDAEGAHNFQRRARRLQPVNPFEM